MFTLKHTLKARSFACLRSFYLSNSRNFSATEEKKFISFEDDEDEEELAAIEAKIEQSRNKSKLQPKHYNIQNEVTPYEVTEFTTLKQKRIAYGTLGEASGINPALLWPTEEELEHMKEYLSVLQPHTIHELIKQCQEKKKLNEEYRRKKEEEALKKVENIDKELLEFHKRYAVKLEKAKAVAQKNQNMIETIRRHFGYKIDPRDKKFKDMVEEIQEKERKRIKEEKKAEKARRVGLKYEFKLKEESEKKESSE